MYRISNPSSKAREPLKHIVTLPKNHAKQSEKAKRKWCFTQMKQEPAKEKYKEKDWKQKKTLLLTLKTNKIFLFHCEDSSGFERKRLPMPKGPDGQALTDGADGLWEGPNVEVLEVVRLVGCFVLVFLFWWILLYFVLVFVGVFSVWMFYCYFSWVFCFGRCCFGFLVSVILSLVLFASGTLRKEKLQAFPGWFPWLHRLAALVLLISRKKNSLK